MAKTKAQMRAELDVQMADYFCADGVITRYDSGRSNHINHSVWRRAAQGETDKVEPKKANKTGA